MSVRVLRPESHFFFFNDTAPTEIYTLSLHDALPILPLRAPHGRTSAICGARRGSRFGAQVPRSEERFSRNAETDLVCRLLLGKKTETESRRRRGRCAQRPRLARRSRPAPTSRASATRRCSASFFFNDTATTEIYTLSLHDALPISVPSRAAQPDGGRARHGGPDRTCAGSVAARGRERGSAGMAGTESPCGVCL